VLVLVLVLEQMLEQVLVLEQEQVLEQVLVLVLVLP
jgi:hypothetical protein